MGSLIIENANLFIGVDEEVIANGAVWVSDGIVTGAQVNWLY